MVLPSHLHQGYGHSCCVDSHVSVQIDYDADVEHVDANWKTNVRTTRQSDVCKNKQMHFHLKTLQFETILQEKSNACHPEVFKTVGF